LDKGKRRPYDVRKEDRYAEEATKLEEVVAKLRQVDVPVSHGSPRGPARST
jgi:hypothetical protein